MENVRTGWSYIRVWVRITQYVCMDCYSCFITGNKLYFILKQLHFCLYANFGVFSFQYTMYMYGIFTLIAVANKMWHIPWVRFVGLIFFFFSFTRDARNMARDVHETLEKIITECGNMDKEKATNYVKQMQNKGRYSCDVWS